MKNYHGMLKLMISTTYMELIIKILSTRKFKGFLKLKFCNHIVTERIALLNEQYNTSISSVNIASNTHGI